jgi:hypothetical protein
MLSPQIMDAMARAYSEGEVAVTDIDASTHHFLDQLREQANELRLGIETARRERDEAAARLADLEKRLADSTAALRALCVYTGEVPQPATGETKTDTVNGPGNGQGLSIEDAILQALRGEDGLTPLEIVRRVDVLGVNSSASSIRARLSKLVRQGTLRRDDKSRYSLAVVGSEATQGS